MYKKSILCFLLITALSVTGSVSAGNSFGREDSSREKSRSQKGFEDLENEIDREFSDEEPVTPRSRKPVKIKQPDVKPAEYIVPEPRRKEASVQGRVVDKAGVTFKLIKCQKVEKTINCQLQVTSHAFDRGLSLHTASQRFFDNIGNEYKGVNVQIGSVQSTYNAGASLISDITTNASVHFRNISTEAESIAVFELRGTVSKDGASNSFAIQYRKIEFSG